MDRPVKSTLPKITYPQLRRKRCIRQGVTLFSIFGVLFASSHLLLSSWQASALYATLTVIITGMVLLLSRYRLWKAAGWTLLIAPLLFPVILIFLQKMSLLELFWMPLYPLFNYLIREKPELFANLLLEAILLGYVFWLKTTGATLAAGLAPALLALGFSTAMIGAIFGFGLWEQRRKRLRNAQMRRQKAKVLRLKRKNREMLLRQEIDDTMIYQQAKLAAMGEMIGNIAHQWRQPLSQLSSILMAMEGAHAYGKLDGPYLNDKVQQSYGLLKFMSQTIEDFRNFSRPTRIKRVFSLYGACQEALSLIGSALQYHRINVLLEGNKELEVLGYPNDFVQVVLNILSNAKDVILERHIPSPTITIRIKSHHSGRHQVTIEDNGGGITQQPIERIFEPYHTTKSGGEGTGIGLYITKRIIEEEMGGQLGAENYGEGAIFTIIV